MFTQGDGADDIGAADDADDLDLRFITGSRLILCVVISWAISSTGVSSLTLMIVLAHDRLNVFALLSDDIGFGNDADDLAVLAGPERR